MTLHLENLPLSLRDKADVLKRCLEVMNRAVPLQRAILFGSHARGDARPDSDVDLCLVTPDAESQLQSARRFRNALWDVADCPSLTLVPITPQRLREKQRTADHFFATVLNEGVVLASED